MMFPKQLTKAIKDTQLIEPHLPHGYSELRTAALDEVIADAKLKYPDLFQPTSTLKFNERYKFKTEPVRVPVFIRKAA